MKGRFPRTAGEFLAADRHLVLRCACGHLTTLDQQRLIVMFGAEFDLYDGFAELQERLVCAACGAPTPDLEFRDFNRDSFGSLSFEESTVDSLELWAFARARDAASAARQPKFPGPQAPRRVGRTRKFGRRR